MPLRLLSVFLLSLCYGSLLGGEGTINFSGKAPGGENRRFEVYRLEDQITGEISTAAFISTDGDSRFNLEMPCSGIETFYIRYGIYDLCFTAEEGSECYTTLPEFRDLSPTERQNPFFEYRKFRLSVNGSEINEGIRRIDSLYFRVTNTITRDIYLGERKEDYSGLLATLGTFSADSSGGYLSVYSSCRILLAKLVSGDDSLLPEAYKILNQQFRIENEAYLDLVKQLFNGILRGYLSGEKAGRVRQMMNFRPSPMDLQELVVEDWQLTNRRLLEYVMVFNLYNEYYSTFFRREGSYQLLKWYSGNGVYELTRELASRMVARIERFQKGSLPAGFSLPGEDGARLSLNELEGRYVLLSFANSESWQSLSEFNIMKGWISEMGGDVAIVTILTDPDYSKAIRKMRSLGYDWIFLDGSNSPGLERSYDVRTYPAFYLLDREGKIHTAPAPMPSENLFRLIMGQLQKDLLQNVRD